MVVVAVVLGGRGEGWGEGSNKVLRGALKFLFVFCQMNSFLSKKLFPNLQDLVEDLRIESQVM